MDIIVLIIGTIAAYMLFINPLLAAVLFVLLIIYAQKEVTEVIEKVEEIPQSYKSRKRNYEINIKTEGEAYPGLTKVGTEGKGPAYRKVVAKTAGTNLGRFLKWLFKVGK